MIKVISNINPMHFPYGEPNVNVVEDVVIEAELRSGELRKCTTLEEIRERVRITATKI